MALSALVFGAGLGQIWISNVQCTGSESRLTECTSAVGSDDYRCMHSEDAGVRCPDENGE